MSNLVKRTITLITLVIATAIIICFSNYSVVQHGITLLIAAGSIYELFHAIEKTENFKKSTYYIWEILAYITAILIICIDIPCYTFYLCITYPFILTGFAVTMMLMEHFSYNRPAKAYLTSLIVILFLPSIIRIRTQENGLYFLCYPVIICCLTDTFAYIFGKWLGKRKLYPKISPNKTWAGAIGGILTSLIVICILVFVFDKLNLFHISYLIIIPFTICTSIVAQFGDFSFSALKRIAGIKDYGNIFPGHGGILDRLDSHIFALPFVLIIKTIFSL